MLETYCQDDVTVLRQACRVFRHEFAQIGNIDVFQESITIGSACNKVLRKRFLQPDTIGLIPKGGYTANLKQSKKALMWLVHRERTDGCTILHGRNGREYRLPELPHLSVDGFCPQTRQCTNSWAAITTAIPANRFVTSRPWSVKRWPRGTSARWLG